MCTLWDFLSIWDPVQCTLSVYLDYVLLWPDDGCITAETCWLEINHRVFICLLILYVVSLDGNKILLPVPMAARSKA